MTTNTELKLHINTLRKIVKKAGYGNGFGWANKSDRYRSASANFEYAGFNSYHDNTNGYIRYTGNRERFEVVMLKMRLWLVENGYTYELLQHRNSLGDMQTTGIKITSLPASEMAA
jgi:hypothetical protein